MPRRSWSVQDAKNQFSAVVEAARSAPQTVTKHGKPVAELRPIERPVRDFFGRDRGKIVIHGDLDDFKMDGEMRD